MIFYLLDESDYFLWYLISFKIFNDIIYINREILNVISLTGMKNTKQRSVTQVPTIINPYQTLSHVRQNIIKQYAKNQQLPNYKQE